MPSRFDRLKHMYAFYHKGRHFCSLDRSRTIPPVLDIFTARVIYLAHHMRLEMPKIVSRYLGPISTCDVVEHDST